MTHVTEELNSFIFSNYNLDLNSRVNTAPTILESTAIASGEVPDLDWNLE